MAEARAWVMIPKRYGKADEIVLDMHPLVLCKDCKYYKDGFCYNPNTYDDEKTRGNTVPDWFCADGEKEDAENH